MPTGMRTNVFMQACLLPGDTDWPKNIAKNLLRMKVNSVLIGQNLWMSDNPLHKNIIDAIRQAGLEIGAHLQPGAWPERNGWDTQPYNMLAESNATRIYIQKIRALGLLSFIYCDGAEVHCLPTPVAKGEDARQRTRRYCEPWRTVSRSHNPMSCFYSSALREVGDLTDSWGSTDQDWDVDALAWAKARAITLAKGDEAFAPKKRIELGWWGERDGTSTTPMPLYPPHYYSGVWDLAIEHKLSITYRVNIDRMAMVSPEYLRVNDVIGEMETHRAKVDAAY